MASSRASSRRWNKRASTHDGFGVHTYHTHLFGCVAGMYTCAGFGIRCRHMWYRLEGFCGPCPCFDGGEEMYLVVVGEQRE